MAPSKVTKSFFNSHRLKYCSECKTHPLVKEISFLLFKPLQDDYASALTWVHDHEAKSFILDVHANSDEIFFNETPELKTLIDIKNTCNKLSAFGYDIPDIRLLDFCENSQCNFKHIIYLCRTRETMKLCIRAETIMFEDCDLMHNYQMQSSHIAINDSRMMKFNLLNLPITNYSSLKEKIKQILLIS
jgi:hypothetical protein